jgi:hypothetical protein
MGGKCPALIDPRGDGLPLSEHNVLPRDRRTPTGMIQVEYDLTERTMSRQTLNEIHERIPPELSEREYRRSTRGL